MSISSESNVKAASYKPPVWPQIKGASVFLAGSIEMGRAVQWQSEMTDSLSHLPVTILNPRRDNWDPSWKQEISNREFKAQVDWELHYLEDADVVALYLQPGTISQISLLELGLYAKSGKLVVCCPKAFGRRGNVEIVCGRYGTTLVETWDELKETVEQRLGKAIEQREHQQSVFQRVLAPWKTAGFLAVLGAFMFRLVKG